MALSNASFANLSKRIKDNIVTPTGNWWI